MKFKVILCFLAYALLTNTLNAEEFPIIQHSIFGIYLGENINALKSKCKNKDIIISEINYDQKYESGVWSFDTSLNDNKHIKETRVRTFNNQIMYIYLYFKDTSASNFNYIIKILEEKYSDQIIWKDTMSERFFDALVKEMTKDKTISYVLTIMLKGEKAGISLHRKEASEENNKDSLYITYSFNRMSIKYSELLMDKSDKEKIKPDLEKDL